MKRLSLEKLTKFFSRTPGADCEDGPVERELLHPLRDWTALFFGEVILFVIILLFCFYTLWQSNVIISTKAPPQADRTVVDRQALAEALAHFQETQKIYDAPPQLPPSLVDPAR